MDHSINIFETSGIPLEMGGNRPFLLGDPGKVWIIRAGHLDVFSVQVRNGEVIGSRTHLFRVKQGESMFGIDFDQNGQDVGLLAVGAAGTQLFQIQRSRFLELAGDPAHTKTASALITGWINGLSSYLGKAEILPKIVQDLEADSEIAVEDGTNLCSPHKMVWVKHLEGSTLFMGRQDWPAISQGVLFPLAAGAWLRCVGKSKLSVRDTRAVLHEDTSPAALDAFHSLILGCIAVNIIQAEDAELVRLERKAEADRSTLKNALFRLKFILEKKKSKLFVPDTEGRPLLTACQMVGKATGISIQAPKSRQAGNGQQESLDDISRINRFRTREVILKDNWWRKDNGPLIAFTDKGKQPVALIPASARSYDLYDPVKGTTRRVTDQVAQTLEPHAYTLYSPLPDRSVTGKDLILMGLRGCSRDIVMVVLMGVCAALLGLLTPLMTGVIFDTIIPEAARSQLLQIAVILVSCALAAAMFEVTKGIAMLRIEGKMDGSIQAAVWDRLLALPTPFFRNYSAGDLANRSMGINAIRMILSGVTVTAILGCLFSSFNLALLFYYDKKLALVAIVISVIGILCTVTASYLQIRHKRKMMKIEGKNFGIVLQFITGIAKLRVSGTEDRAFAVWAENFAKKKTLAFKAGTIENILATFNSSFPVLALMAIFAWMILKGTGELSTGGFLAFNSAYSSFQNALLQMAMALTASLNIFPLYERAKPIFQALPETDKTKAIPEDLGGEIEVSHVNFRYSPDGPPILKDVSLHISPGEFVAIVGGSGSGKSTLLRLLLGFETPESGTIYYDGQDLDSLDIREVRRQIGVVLQNGKVMQDDIFKNIVGASNLTVNDAWEAARMVGFDEDIKEMPMGMHTMVPAGGGTLSGGQRQRLIIARAVVKKPRILYFDEATSALDNRTQSIVSRSLEGLHVTRIVIAHRLSTIINADRIYVLQHGEMIQSGTYDELMRREGFFSELARRQIA